MTPLYLLYFSFCIQCYLEGIPIFTEISFLDILTYIFDYYIKEMKWIFFRLRYWKYFNSSGHIVTAIPQSIPRMAWGTRFGTDCSLGPTRSTLTLIHGRFLSVVSISSEYCDSCHQSLILWFSVNIPLTRNKKTSRIKMTHSCNYNHAIYSSFQKNHQALFSLSFNDKMRLQTIGKCKIHGKECINEP